MSDLVSDTAVRPASSVLLLRATPALEVFVLQRVSGMAFAGGMTAFPGGGLDDRDHQRIERWAGPPMTWWQQRLGRPDAGALVVAAVRELFEEVGVLLAGPPAVDGVPPSEVDPRSMGGAREELITHRRSLADILEARGWVVGSDLLRPVANWVTPLGQTRRYDTFFFAGRLPAGQHAALLTTEADVGRWIQPSLLLDEADGGSVQILPPTRAMLELLAAAPSVEAVLAADHRLEPVRPSVGLARGGRVQKPRPPEHDVPQQVSRLATVVLAANPGPMTGWGTNSYLLNAPAGTGCVVVDPGPDDPAHLELLAAQPVELILITHRHVDHTAGARWLAERTGAPVRAADPAHCIDGRTVPGPPLADGEKIMAGRVRITVIGTPGHTDDSVCFHLPDDEPLPPAGPPVGGSEQAPVPATRTTGAGPGSVLTGDTVLGAGSTVIAHPDGRLADYLDSLHRLAAIGGALMLPAHGPQLPDLAAVCAQYLDHRRQRLEQVRDALRQVGPAARQLDEQALTARVVELVHPDVDPAVRFAAQMSVRAQLAYLRA